MQRVRVIAQIATAIVAAGIPASAVYATPSNNAPTLHGFCGQPQPANCYDNGTNTPTSLNPPAFGFSAGGHSATGTVYIDFLIPDNVSNPASLLYTFVGPAPSSSSYSATLFTPSGHSSPTPWTSGFLDSYLGISAQPANGIDAFLPSMASYTGYYVYQASLGSFTLPANSDTSHLFQLNQSVPQGSYIVAFIDQNGNYGATANSGAILETRAPVPEPATWAMMLVGFGGIGAAMRRRRSARIPQVA